MGVLDELALRGADRVERTLGKRAALRALVPLLDSLPAGPGRARALRRALGYAAELDALDLPALCERWATDGSRRLADVKPIVRRLLVSGRTDAAQVLARAALSRTQNGSDEANAHYVLGRCLEATDPPEALACYDRAASLAVDRPSLRRAAEVRTIRVLRRSGRRWEAAQRAVSLLSQAPDVEAPSRGSSIQVTNVERSHRWRAADRLAVASAALEATGRYLRVAALDSLQELAREGGVIGRQAVALGAAHAEASGPSLSDIEADRLDVLLSHHPDAAARRLATERLRALRAYAEESEAAELARTDPAAEAFLPRVLATLEGRSPGPRPEDPRAAQAWLALTVVHALSQDRASDIERALSEATDRVRAGGRGEAALWTAAALALPASKEQARHLIAALLDARGEPPPRGYRSIAAALESVGLADEAVTALRRAAARREPGARDALARRLRRLGWRAAEEGRRDEAIALLREARPLASRASRREGSPRNSVQTKGAT